MQRRDTVLVVDDSPDSLNFLTDALEGGGLTVLVALSGTSALNLIDRVRPDIVLMDAVMPGIDGFETCRRLKASSAFVDLPVIFMTGLSQTEHIIQGIEAGGVDYVAKPIVPDELIARMQRHPTNARLARAARAALDATGRFLIAVDQSGRTVWCTPQAGQLLDAKPGSEGNSATLPDEVARWLQTAHETAATRLPSECKSRVGRCKFHISDRSASTKFCCALRRMTCAITFRSCKSGWL